jgi:hypothetical protein
VAQTTLQDAGDLIGDRADTRRTRSDFEEPPVALTATEPFPSRHLFLVQSLDPQSYGEAAGNPFWESAMQEEYKSLLENRTWIRFPFLLRGNLSDAYGSPGPRAHRMDILTDTKLGLFPKAFNNFMVLTMMRPSLQ